MHEHACHLLARAASTGLLLAVDCAAVADMDACCAASANSGPSHPAQVKRALIPTERFMEPRPATGALSLHHAEPQRVAQRTCHNICSAGPSRALSFVLSHMQHSEVDSEAASPSAAHSRVLFRSPG